MAADSSEDLFRSGTIWANDSDSDNMSGEEADENAILISMIAEDVHKYLMKRIKKKARIATADSFDFAGGVVSGVKDIINNEREDRESQIRESRGDEY